MVLRWEMWLGLGAGSCLLRPHCLSPARLCFGTDGCCILLSSAGVCLPERVPRLQATLPGNEAEGSRLMEPGTVPAPLQVPAVK